MSDNRAIETPILKASRVTVTHDFRGVACVPHPVIRIEIIRDWDALSFDLSPAEAIAWAECVIRYARGECRDDEPVQQVGGLLKVKI